MYIYMDMQDVCDGKYSAHISLREGEGRGKYRPMLLMEEISKKNGKNERR
jgi:hypothetical protein